MLFRSTLPLLHTPTVTPQQASPPAAWLSPISQTHANTHAATASARTTPLGLLPVTPMRSWPALHTSSHTTSLPPAPDSNRPVHLHACSHASSQASRYVRIIPRPSPVRLVSIARCTPTLRPTHCPRQPSQEQTPSLDARHHAAHTPPLAL